MSAQRFDDRIRIMIATEEPILALGATCLLASSADFDITRCPATYMELIPLLRQETPDLLVLDLAPEVTPLLFSGIRETAPGCNVVLWGRSISTELSFHARQQGIHSVLPRAIGTEELLNQLRRIGRGEPVIDKITRERTTTIPLTRRESQVVSLLAQGLKNKEIASCLDLSEGTVKSYLVHLFRKVGARDRFELAVLGLKNTYCGQAFWDGENSFVSEPEEDRARPALRSLVLVEPARRRGYPENARRAGRHA